MQFSESREENRKVSRCRVVACNQDALERAPVREYTVMVAIEVLNELKRR